MRRVLGWFGWESNDPADLAPYVTANVQFEDSVAQVDFLIDTGSDSTILMPTDAFALLGQSYLAMNFRTRGAAVRLQGVTPDEGRVVPIDAVLRLEDEFDAEIVITQRIYLAEPLPPYESREGNWDFSSLFGRDLIRPGDFELSYQNRTVTLIRPDFE